ncbi:MULTISPECIES: serine hydrolase [unclassified Pseudoalteromonas]|uniref:serine hydrolase n=1 Tax=unclassified Pseudoalteromonas TaxID=194690 RepID=UPI0005AB5E15|nr:MULTISPECIES: serine hydrolase [unclassified Pseudoalteromonas]
MKLRKLKIFSAVIFMFTNNLMATVGYADETDDLIKKIMIERSIPGLQLAIVKNGKIIKSQAYGQSNIQHSVKVTEETVFPINSMTKLFVGVAVMQLVELNKLTLDDEIGKHLPELPSSWHHIKIKQLFAHTSGLPNILSGRHVDLIASNDPDAAWQKVQTKPFKFRSNSQFQYNQTGYVILGKLINKLANQSFTDFIIEHQLVKIGMPLTKQAGFAYLEDVITNQANQYRFRQNGKLRNEFAEFAPLMRAAAGMSANANELAKYTIALQSGAILNESSLNDLWDPIVLNNGRTAGFSSFENGYAIGWQVENRKAHRGVSASGANANTLMIYPDDDLSIIILTNLLGALPIQFVDEIASIYIPDMKKENGWQVPFEVLKAEAANNAFENIVQITSKIEAQFGVFFNVGEINHWGYELINQKNYEGALAVFTLNTILNPDVTNTFDSLGETYFVIKQYKNALVNYEKVLDLDPSNRWAKKQIKAINQAYK